MVRAFYGIVCLGVASLVGCGGGLGQVPASGTVLLDGEPVEGVQVMLAPESPDGHPASGVTDAAGKFQLTTEINGDGAVPGNYKVAISKYEETGPDVPEGDPNSDSADDVDMDAMYGALESGGTVKSTSLVAKKYNNPATSGLTATVTEDPEQNVFEFKVSKK